MGEAESRAAKNRWLAVAGTAVVIVVGWAAERLLDAAVEDPTARDVAASFVIVAAFVSVCALIVRAFRPVPLVSPSPPASPEATQSPSASAAGAKRRPLPAPIEYQAHALSQVVSELERYGFRDFDHSRLEQAVRSTERTGTDAQYEPLTLEAVELGLETLENKGRVIRVDPEWGNTFWQIVPKSKT